MGSLRSILAAAAVAGLLVPAPAGAGETADAGLRAEQLAGEGRNREAWEALTRAADAIWATAPLEFRTLILVAGEPQAFGVYEPRPGNAYKPGEEIFVYGEPFGFGYRAEGDFVTIEFDVRIAVANPQGTEEIPPRSGRLVLKSRYRNKEFMLYFSYLPQGLKPGDHVLHADFRDTATGKTASARLPFRIE